MHKKVLIFLFVFVATLVSAHFVCAATVVPVNLEKMSMKAGRIFHGVCTGVKVVNDERGLLATEVTYQVLRSVKGEVGDRITFKVFGAAVRDGHNQPSAMVGSTQYYSGREDVLFLYGDSPWGFTSPVGLWQGDFPVTRRDSGEAELVRTSSSYRNAIPGVSIKASAKRGKVVTPDDLLDEVEDILHIN